MYHKKIDAPIILIFLFITLQRDIFVHSQCPSNLLIEPCSCIETNSSDFETVLYPTLTESIPIRQKSIVCEHIYNSSFDLRAIFIAISTDNNDSNVTHFNDFLLHNTELTHLPENLFGSITFSTIILYNNPLLNSIDLEAFNNTRESVEVFKTFNTSLSDNDTLFTMLRQFTQLRFLSMENDKLHSIPDYAFNQTELRYIWLGVQNRQTSQPFINIGKYPFYNVPNLISLWISSPLLTKINKYSLALSTRSMFNGDDLNHMLFIEIAGSMLNATSFEATSLTRFRSRPVFLRLYNTNIDYLDEEIFQPFLETHPASLLGIENSNISRICDSRSAWIKDEYCTNINWRENRVYGSACCSL